MYIRLFWLHNKDLYLGVQYNSTGNAQGGKVEPVCISSVITNGFSTEQHGDGELNFQVMVSTTSGPCTGMEYLCAGSNGKYRCEVCIDAKTTMIIFSYGTR